MIITGQNSVGYVNLAVQVVDSSNVPVAADASPVASFYRVDATSGTLALDTMVGTGGSITLSSFAGVTGLYSCPVLVSSLLHKQYHVRITWAVSGQSRAQLQDLVILTELDVISRDAITPIASTRYTTSA